MLVDGVRDRHTVMVQPHAASHLREGGSIESDLIRFEEDVSPAPRAAECARFLLLLLPAGMVGGRGKRGCVIGGAEGDGVKRTPPLYSGAGGPYLRKCQT